MKSKWTLIVLGAVLLSGLATGAATSKPATPAGNDLMDKAAKIKAGSSTGVQVSELLGAPWRSTNYGDCHPVDYQEIWEYVGHDSTGLFRIHIEFDDNGVAQIVAKVPQKGPITVLAATPKPGMQHRH
jgi:outer membrane protein assembly factor BamE (lipoprotein component of BamABCDE complex)